MFDKDILKRVKSACVGIGLRAKDNSFLKIVGSGFLLKEGYVLTTKKILEACDKRLQAVFTEIGVVSDIVPVHIIENELKIDLDFVPYSKIMAESPLNLSDSFSGRDDFGLTGTFITANNKSRPFLEIKRDHKLNLFDEVCICGYPSGEQSLDLGKKFSGLRLSPVIQFGRITGFMPTDETPIPYGLQTDIIGTSGSSGSPIVDLIDGKVIGMVEDCIYSKIKGNLNVQYLSDTGKIINQSASFDGMADIGLIYGQTYGSITGLGTKIKDDIQKDKNQTKNFFPISEVRQK